MTVNDTFLDMFIWIFLFVSMSRIYPPEIAAHIFVTPDIKRIIHIFKIVTYS